jgi:hypothetical protein
MDLISSSVSSLLSEFLNHFEILSLFSKEKNEDELLMIANNSFEEFKSKSLTVFQKSTEVAGRPTLYEQMLPELENDLSSHLASFQNQLNTSFLVNSGGSKLNIVSILWFLEALVLISTIALGIYWLRNPDSNVEPILVILGALIPLVYLGIRKFGPEE